MMRSYRGFVYSGFVCLRRRRERVVVSALTRDDHLGLVEELVLGDLEVIRRGSLTNASRRVVV